MDLPYPSRALGTSFLTLAAVPTAVGCSRQMIRLALNRWGLARMADNAELVVSELATNAVQATGVVDADATWSDLGNLATIHVRLLLFGASVVIEVWDRGTAAPAPQETAEEEEGGRGLSIVTALTTKWGYCLAPHGGKVVYAELLIPPYPRTSAGLPQRSRAGAVPGAHHGGLVGDLALLRRIHRGLKNLKWGLCPRGLARGCCPSARPVPQREPEYGSCWPVTGNNRP